MTASPSGDATATHPTRALLDWFERQDRDVPWRGERDPYRILVAEVMAQQTRMATVGPYYRRFIDRFPDIGTLASAELDDVLKLWEGLGYYARARNLHAAARVAAAELGGRLPDTAPALRALPGVGPYTAGAVASLAFGRPEPAIDGNARRVLSRLFDLDEPSPRDYEDRARELLLRALDRPGALNQALMDLGSRVCVPRRPRCEACPLAAPCLARARDTVEIRPARSKRGPFPTRHRAAAVVHRQDRVLVLRRPEGGLLGGLWDFPSVSLPDPPGAEDDAPDARSTLAAGIARDLGISVRVDGRARTIRHTFSHFRLRLSVHEAAWHAGELPLSVSGRWAARPDLGALAFPGYCRPILEDLGGSATEES